MADTLEKTKIGQEPRIVQLPTQKMAVVYSQGDPEKVMEMVMPALYGSVYRLKAAYRKEGKSLTVGPLCARWPNAHIAPRDEWIGIWGLPIPADVASLPQRYEYVEVDVEDWVYGTVAQVMHIGPYRAEAPTIQRLRDFIEEQGYEIVGIHEEVYLTGPTARVQKTLIRYPIRKCEGQITALGPVQERALRIRD